MEIKTKFNVGDKVWYIQCRKVKCAIITYIITETLAERSATIIGYELNTEIGNYGEEDLFATQAKAQAECDKRNKGE